MVLKERQRREIDPALTLLQDCAENTEKDKTTEGIAFHKQMKELEEFAQLASNVGDKVGRLKYGPALKIAAKVLGVG